VTPLAVNNFAGMESPFLRSFGVCLLQQVGQFSKYRMLPVDRDVLNRAPNGKPLSRWYLFLRD